MRDKALELLRKALNDPRAEFRDGQWECIERLLNGERLLVVQRTGWGKSMVYFLATRFLRDAGNGPTLLISPLLSLMRNQLEAARRIGVRAKTINSTNTSEWPWIEQELLQDKVDILLISPERLASASFGVDVFVRLADRVGLLVVDEAHCISDWGHEFRPNYRRIVRVLSFLPRGMPVLATTATANGRVVADVVAQLGQDLKVVAGPLQRESLRLQNINLLSPTARMAWLAQTIPSLPGSGIVYVLTKRDAERVAEWLRLCGIDAEAYHAGLMEEHEDSEEAEEQKSMREALERRLLANDVKVLVATVALGMGFDKPDLGFVIHFQRPASVVHYYQQVGRAGRAIGEAYGVLLHGAEDDDIAEYFRITAFPPQEHADVILAELQNADGGLSVAELEARLNLRRSQISKALTYMSVEEPAPVAKPQKKWQATPSSFGYRISQALVGAVLDIRRREQEDMSSYMGHTGCLMEFLERALDDSAAAPCGVCSSCRGTPLLPVDVNCDLANEAAIFLKRGHLAFEPRAQWPKGALVAYGFSGKIDDTVRAEEGWVLCTWRDAGWGSLVADGKYEAHRFDDELVRACVAMVREWAPLPQPEWVTCVPSIERPELVSNFARRLAEALGLPFREALRKVSQNRPQKEMQNSFQQARNLDGVFEVEREGVDVAPCLLVDDVVDSRWTMTVAAALLRQAGCSAVFPLALALNSLGSE
jgi:ATP-dependent DNA helicase RecQ